MTKKLYADTEKVVIYEGDDNVIDNPNARLGDVYFHSNLSYMEVVQSPRTNVTIPAVSSQPQKDTITVFAHGLGYIPIVTAFNHTLGLPMTGTHIMEMIQSEFSGHNNFALRTLNLSADSQNVYLLHFGDYWEVNLSEVTYDIQLYIYRKT